MIGFDNTLTAQSYSVISGLLAGFGITVLALLAGCPFGSIRGNCLH